MTAEDAPRNPDGLFGLSLDRRGLDRVRAVVNVLTESTFFYNEDDPDLFFFLRRNQASFKELFERYFGWRLFVDEQVARLIKERQFNQKLRPSQRFLFDLRRRDECLLFTLLLEFHEEESRRQGVGPNDPRYLRFLLSDFISHAIRRSKEELGVACPSEGRLFEATKPLFEQLERHRFVRLVEKSQAEAGDVLPAGMDEQLLFEFLPGIRCYDASLAARSVVVKAYRSEKDDERLASKPDESATQEVGH